MGPNFLTTCLDLLDNMTESQRMELEKDRKARKNRRRKRRTRKGVSEGYPEAITSYLIFF